jgi:hypothetical protein
MISENHDANDIETKELGRKVDVSPSVETFIDDWNSAALGLRMALDRLGETVGEINRSIDELRGLQDQCARDDLITEAGSERLQPIEYVDLPVDIDLGDLAGFAEERLDRVDTIEVIREALS